MRLGVISFPCFFEIIDLQQRKMAHSAPEKDVALAYSVDSARDSASDEGPRLRANPWWRFGGKDQSFVPVNVPSTAKSTRSSSDEDEHANENTIYGSVFSDSRAQDFYKPIEKYEGRHRFDMHATWSEDEEKNLVRRVSTYLYPWLSDMNQEQVDTI